jgi:hypothetical protein
MNPIHGTVRAFTSFGAFCPITIGPSYSVRPPSRIVTTGAHPNPNWKIRTPSKLTGWLIVTSSWRTGVPSGAINSTFDVKSIGTPLRRNASE